MEPIGPIDIAEEKLLVAPFTQRELGTAVLVSAVWTCEVVSGSDPDAATRLIGVPIIESPQSKHRIRGAGMPPGATYNIRCVGTDSVGLKHVAAALLSAVRMAV